MAIGASYESDELAEIERAVTAERQRCAGIIEIKRNEWIKHTHQDEASRLVIEVLNKCAERLREEP